MQAALWRLVPDAECCLPPTPSPPPLCSQVPSVSPLRTLVALKQVATNWDTPLPSAKIF